MSHSPLFKSTASSAGRNIMITPQTSDFKYISAGRIILNADMPRVTARNESAETTLLVLHGSGRVIVGDETFEVSRFDGVYVTRGAEFTVETDEALDIFEGSAPTELEFPTSCVRAADVEQNDTLRLRVGAEPYYRDIYKVLAENIEGSRLLTGVTMSKPGNWTSWPPHEHAATQEELYLYFDIPRPGFGTQWLFKNLENPEHVMTVYEDDAVVIAKGYHPNVAAPGSPMNFAWLLCSLEERTYRQVGGVNVHPDFQQTNTGLK